MRAALVVLSILAAGCAPDGAERAQALREGWLYVGVSETPPEPGSEALGTAAEVGDGLQWQRVVLPDTWDRARRRRGTEGWYRFEVSLPQTPDALQAVYLPRASLNARIHFNGVMVGHGGASRIPPFATSSTRATRRFPTSCCGPGRTASTSD